MAQIDTSIYGRFAPTVKLKSPYEIEDGFNQIQQGQNQNRLAQRQFQEADRVDAERNALAGIAQQHGSNPEAYGNALTQGGFVKQSQDFNKYQADAAMSGVELKNKQLTGQKLQGEITQEQRERSAAKLGAHLSDPTLTVDKVYADLQSQVESGELQLEQAQAMAQRLPQDPAQLKPFLNQILMGVMKPKEQADLGFKERDFRQNAAQDPFNADGTPNTGVQNYGIQKATASANMQYVPGSDYKPSGVFNPRTGQFSPSATTEQTPAPQPDKMAPWNGMPPKKADDLRARMYATESKKLDDLRDQVLRGREVVRELDRFGTLNREQGTGGITDRVASLPTFDAEKREMEAISSRLAPFQRAPGSGASSDRDVSLFLQGLPGIDKQGPVNANIRTQYAKGLKEAEQAVDFAERYFAEKGHLNGFSAAYKASKGDKPDTKPTGNPVSDVTPEQAAFIQKRRAAGVSDGQTAQELNQQSKSAAKASGTFKDPISVTNDADYNNVPKGKYYKAPDGSIRVRK